MMKGQGRTLLVYCWSFLACDRKGQAFLMTADGVAGTSHRPNVINLNINPFNAATVLYYKDEDTRSARGAAASDEDGNGRRMRENSINIPVLGPIPGQSPLLLGAELALEPPTPLQWYTLEEAALIQEQQQVPPDQCSDSSSSVSSLSGKIAMDAAIDASPLVAILDQASGEDNSNVNHPWMLEGKHHSGGKRYATLAAVVGMTLAAGTNLDSEKIQKDEAASSSSFWQSLHQARLHNNKVVASQAKIRLVGVGRAALSNFFYRMPSQLAHDVQDEDGYLQNVDSKVQRLLEENQETTIENKNTKDGDDRKYDEDDDSLWTNVLMAQFRVLQDQEKHGGNGVCSSPIHALSQMSTWASRLQFLHQDRQRLVAELQAAKARLQLVGLHDDICDYDGLEQLFSQKEGEEESPDLVPGGPGDDQSFVNSSIGSTSRDDCNRDYDKLLMDEAAKSPLSGPLMGSIAGHADTGLSRMENYGMGYSAASVCTLPAMTHVWMETLSSYYSPQWREREEYFYEIYSFVSIMAMKQFLIDKQLAWSLKCTNTVERMERTYEWMRRHVQLLKQEGEKASQELQDCGEECAGLW